MQAFLELLGSFSLVFCLAYAVTYIVLLPARKTHQLGYRPLENARVRFKTPTNLYRSRLLEFNDTEWIFAAPLQRDSFVPIDLGTEVVCEVVARGGLLIFKSVVIARDADQGSLTIKAPESPKLSDRRDSIRRVDLPFDIHIGGFKAELMDISTDGARIKINGFQKEGKTLEVDLGNGEHRIATIIDSKLNEFGSILRVRFDRPVTIPD